MIEKRILIFSNELLFARMIMHELFYSRSQIETEIFINDFSRASEGINDIIIVDLDSGYSENMFLSNNIIGFSSRDNFFDNKLYFRCAEFLHRPFLLSELSDAVKKLYFENGELANESLLSSAKEKKLVFLESGSGIYFFGKRLHLSRNEYELLSFLYANKNTALSREELNGVLNSKEGNMCDVYICRLRTKLGEISNEKVIYTVRNKGYMLKFVE